MHYIYCGMAKGTSWAEAMSNSKNFKPVALAIVELCESESISQLVGWSVGRSVSQSVRQADRQAVSK